MATAAALQVACAAAAGAFGELVQFLTLALLLLLSAATVQLVGEGLVEAIVEGLEAAFEDLPLEVRGLGNAGARRPF